MMNTCLKSTGARRGLVHSVLWTSLLFGLGTGPVSAATNLVRMVNFAFQPQFLTNRAGDTVVWTNTTPTFHNTVASNGLWTTSTFPSPGTFAFTFTNAGTYGYFCAPHRSFGMAGIIYVNPAPNSLPEVAITNPPAGALFVAPATVTLRAAASDPDGTVASVQFFQGENLLGSAPARPFDLVLNGLTSRTYNFTARAFDNLGAVSTSSVVSVSVVDLLLDPSLVHTGNQVDLTFDLTPGFSYQAEGSTDLATWEVLTNFLAPATPFTLSIPTAGFDRRFFRARVLSGP